MLSCKVERRRVAGSTRKEGMMANIWPRLAVTAMTDWRTAKTTQISSKQCSNSTNANLLPKQARFASKDSNINNYPNE